MRELQPDSSPGYPWMREAATNEEFTAKFGEDAIVDMVIARMQALEGNFEGPYHAVHNNMVDPIRLFIKNELHSADKARQKRFRLIASVSVIDQLVERVLFSAQNKAEIAQWSSIPSKPGLGLHDEGLEVLRDEMAAYSKPVETDVSGFDWSVKGWMLRLDAVARLRLAGFSTSALGLGNTVVERIVLNRVRCLSQAVFVFSDGQVISQGVPGIQKSGSYNTSSTNSRIRWMLARLAGAKAAMTMGDDCVEEYAEGAPAVYERVGLLIKGYKTVTLSEGISFCSHTFTESGVEPERWARMLAGLLQKKPRSLQHQEELLTALRFDLRHSSKLQYVEWLLVQSGWGLHKDS